MTFNGSSAYDDNDLIDKVKCGDLSAYTLLVERYESQILSCLYVRLENPDDAYDLAQETFLLAYRKLNEFDQSESFSRWLRGIAFNFLRNFLRKKLPMPVGGNAELELLIDEHIQLSHSEETESAFMDALVQCVGKLNEGMRRLVEQYYSSNLSIDDLTQVYNTRHSTMTMRLHRIRQRLRSCIEQSVKDFD